MAGDSGEAIYTLRRPGPELGITLGRLTRTLKVRVEGKSQDEVIEEVDARISEEQELSTASRIVEACITGPVKLTEKGQAEMKKAGLELTEVRIIRNPSKPGEFTAADLPAQDFYQILAWHNAGCPDIPVKMEGGGTSTIAEVETFPVEPGGRNQSGSDGAGVQLESSIGVGHP